MKTADFDYTLSPDRIAQSPATPRDSCRLMVLNTEQQTIEHRRFFELTEYLRPGDLLVVNESKVFKARLQGTIGRPKGEETSPLQKIDSVEIFLLRPEGACWIALAQPAKKLSIGTEVIFNNGSTCRIVEKRQEDGTVLVDFNKPAEEVFALADTIGEVPTPPYIETKPEEAKTVEEEYQTVYAKTIGSVAAPTAGFHFTPELLEKLKAQGAKITTLTLHVGLGTFRPMKTDTLEAHVMHEEWLDVPDETLNAIEETKKNGGRVIAVGTTCVRALESGIQHGFTKLFITPGFEFKRIDGMITNFHVPKSTLLVLVSAFAGREYILRAYQEALEKEYRFYSFGDAMLIV